MTPDIKITYFNVKALAEPTRMLLKYGGIDFVDTRIERDDPAWNEIKKGMPFGQLPILEENGRVIHQSIAIARYAAKKVKLVGENDWENLEIDAIVDTINDFRAKIAVYAYEQNEEVKATRKTQLEKETIPYYLEKFEQIAKDNNGHFALGRLTWADFFFAGVLDYLNFMIGKDLIADSPNLKQVVENVNSIPTVKAWIDSRPQTAL